MTGPAATGPGGAWWPRLRRALRRAWPVLRFLFGIGIGALAILAVNGKRGELADASTFFSHMRWGWVMLAVLAEAGAILSFAALQGRLLQSGGYRVHMGPLAAITLAGNSINNSLPGGAAFASVYAYRQYRHYGADEALSAWTVVATGLAAGTALAALAAIGLLIPGSEGSSLNLVGATLIALIGILVVGIVVFVVLLRMRALGRALTWFLRRLKAFSGIPRRAPELIVEELSDRLTAFRPTKKTTAAALSFAFGNWLLDCGCLALAFAAVGAPVPWGGLLLAYGAGQLAANLPITPGGLGVVEGSLTIALVAYGGALASTVSAVLLYRIINFWGSLPLGWLAFAGLALRHRRRQSSPEAEPVEAMVA